MAKQMQEALMFPLSWTRIRDKHYDWRVTIHNNQLDFITFNKIKITAETAREKHIGVQLQP